MVRKTELKSRFLQNHVIFYTDMISILIQDVDQRNVDQTNVD